MKLKCILSKPRCVSVLTEAGFQLVEAGQEFEVTPETYKDVMEAYPECFALVQEEKPTPKVVSKKEIDKDFA
jgi:hypothetical protein